MAEFARGMRFLSKLIDTMYTLKDSVGGDKCLFFTKVWKPEF